MVTNDGKTASPDPREAAEAFALRLQEAHGEDLISVIMYGSAAREEYRPGVSDVNVLVILRELGFAQLSATAAMTREWMSRGNTPPLMLSEAEWRASADVFAIEYSDIREANVVVFGADPFVGLVVDREHLRLQVESELRAKKIQLREGILVGADTPEELGLLLRRALPSFLTLFRAALRLAEEPVPGTARSLVESMAVTAGFNPAPVLAVLAQREIGETVPVAVAGSVAAGFLEAVERTVDWLDGFDTGSSGGASS